MIADCLVHRSGFISTARFSSTSFCSQRGVELLLADAHAQRQPAAAVSRDDPAGCREDLPSRGLAARLGSKQKGEVERGSGRSITKLLLVAHW